MKKKIDSFLNKYIEKILFIFLILNPILDVIAAVGINYFNVSITLSSIFRMIFLFLCISYLLFIDKNSKKRNIILTVSFIIYLLLDSIVILKYKGLDAYFYEIKNTLNTFYFPFVLISLIDIFKQYKINIDLKQIVIIYSVYLFFILVPNLFHIGFLSYYHSKVGNSGWFISANAVGNILSILLPLILYYILKDKLDLKKIILIISILYVFVSLGTKVPVLSLFIVFMINIIYFLIKWIKYKEYSKVIISIVISIILVITSIIIIPKTSFYKNIQIHKKFLKIDHYSEILTDYKLMDHFIFSQRLTFLSRTNKNYQKASLPEKIVGIGYIENYGTDEVSMKTIEIDYFEIFYRQGIIGCILFLIIIINPFIESIKKLKEKKLFNLEFKISILLILLLSLFSGHILVTPAVSIYVALIISLPYSSKFLKN